MSRDRRNRIGVTKSIKKTRASPAFFHLPLLKGQVAASEGMLESSTVVLGVSSPVIISLGFIQRPSYDHTVMDRYLHNSFQ